MWQDLMKPVEPVEKRFAKGKTSIMDNGCLHVEIVGVESNKFHIILGSSGAIGVNKESAKRLSAMFMEIYNQLEE